MDAIYVGLIATILFVMVAGFSIYHMQNKRTGQRSFSKTVFFNASEEDEDAPVNPESLLSNNNGLIYAQYQKLFEVVRKTSKGLDIPTVSHTGIKPNAAIITKWLAYPHALREEEKRQITATLLLYRMPVPERLYCFDARTVEYLYTLIKLTDVVVLPDFTVELQEQHAGDIAQLNEELKNADNTYLHVLEEQLVKVAFERQPVQLADFDKRLAKLKIVSPSNHVARFKTQLYTAMAYHLDIPIPRCMVAIDDITLAFASHLDVMSPLVDVTIKDDGPLIIHREAANG